MFYKLSHINVSLTISKQSKPLRCVHCVTSNQINENRVSIGIYASVLRRQKSLLHIYV